MAFVLSHQPRNTHLVVVGVATDLALALDPVRLASAALGMDPWQGRVLRSTAPVCFERCQTVGEMHDRGHPRCAHGSLRAELPRAPALPDLEAERRALQEVPRGLPFCGPALARIKLKDLTPAQVRWFYRDRLDSGLAPATVHELHMVLHKALKAAVSDGLIPRNAAAGLKLPRITREEIDPLDAEGARRLLEAARGDRLEALYVLALNTGMRQGELLALK